MIIISSSVVLSPTEEFGSNNPVIGIDNLVTVDNVTAETEAAGYPITNVANPITSPGARWRANDTTEQAVSVVVNTVEEIDYIAVARHNFGSAQIPVTVEGSTDGGMGWSELVAETLLADDAPAIFRFDPQALTNIRLVLGEGDEAAEIAVLYTGKLLILQRRVYVGHTPITYGRSTTIVNGKSEGGDFLGRIVTSEQRSTSVDLKNITPAWYRQSMDPFIEASKDTPFFFAWRPGDYPNEVGFCWMTNEPQPQNARPNGMMNIQMQMTGIAP